MEVRGYSDGSAWRLDLHFLKTFIQSVAIATDRVVALATQIRGRRYCDEKVSTEQKTLRRGNIHAFPWILPCFSVAKLITCTSDNFLMDRDFTKSKVGSNLQG